MKVATFLSFLLLMALTVLVTGAPSHPLSLVSGDKSAIPLTDAGLEDQRQSVLQNQRFQRSYNAFGEAESTMKEGWGAAFGLD